MNAQLLEDEGLGPDPPHRDRLRSKEELSQAEKVTLDLGWVGRAGCLPPVLRSLPRVLSEAVLLASVMTSPSARIAVSEIWKESVHRDLA
jgi:hypothetical protein